MLQITLKCYAVETNPLHTLHRLTQPSFAPIRRQQSQKAYYNGVTTKPYIEFIKHQSPPMQQQI